MNVCGPERVFSFAKVPLREVEDLGIDVDARTLDSQRLLQPSAATGQQGARTTDGNSNPTTGPSLATREEEERADALSQMRDQLEMVKAWWILEWLPLRHHNHYFPEALLVVRFH